MDIAPLRDASAEAALLSRVFTVAVPMALLLTHGNVDESNDIAQEVVCECLARLRTRFWRVDTTLEELVAMMVWCHHDAAQRGEEDVRAGMCQHASERHGRIAAWMDPARNLADREADAAYLDALRELPATCRAVFVLVREEDASYEDVAARFEIGLTHVRKLLRRAEVHLGARLGMMRPKWRMPRSVLAATRRQARTARPEQSTVLAEARTPLSAQRALRLEQGELLPEQRALLPEQQTVLPEQQTVLPEQRALLTGLRALLPEGRTPLPERPTLLPESQTQLRELRTALRLPRAAKRRSGTAPR